MNPHFETPQAVKDDAHTLAEDAKSLVARTAEITEEKIAETRVQLRKAVTESKECAAKGIRVVDQAIRSRPYQSIAIAFGLGALLGAVLGRRS